MSVIYPTTRLVELINKRRRSKVSGLKCEVKPGEVVLFQTWDASRVDFIFSLNRMRFRELYLVDVGSRSVFKEAAPGKLNVLLRTIRDREVTSKAPITPSTFLTRIAPTLSSALMLVKIPSEWSMHAIPELPQLGEGSAIAVMTASLEDVPPLWQTRLTRLEDAYFADPDEIRLILSKNVNADEFKGLTIAELKRLALAPPAERRSMRDALRDIRLKVYGLKRVTDGVDITELPIDSYLLQHLSRHLGRLSRHIILTGPSGSGKTFILKSISSSFFQNTYLLDAGIIMQGESIPINEVLMTIDYMSEVALVINEFDHLASAHPKYKTRLLSFLERRRPIWLGGTAVNIEPLLTSTHREVESELLRPGRIDEVIPVPPPFETSTKIGMVGLIARELKIDLDPSAIRRIALCAPLLYPADYTKLVYRYDAEGAGAISQFIDVYDVDARAERLQELIELLRALGNTSEELLSRIERYIEVVA